MEKNSFDVIFDWQARQIIAKIVKKARVVLEDGTDTAVGRVKIKNNVISVNNFPLNGTRIKSYLIFSCLKKERRWK